MLLAEGLGQLIAHVFLTPVDHDAVWLLSISKVYGYSDQLVCTLRTHLFMFLNLN